MRKSVLLTPLVVLLASAWAAACIDARPVIYPLPQEVCLGDPVDLGATYRIADPGPIGPRELVRYREFLSRLGLDEAAEADLAISFTGDAPEHKTLLEERQEGYTIKLDSGRLVIGALSDIGFYYALQTLGQMVDDGQVYTAEITDWPAFPVRGVLEGGYGAWLYEDRIRVLQTLGPLKLNYFIYGPKEGLKYRRRWRGLHDEWELREFMMYQKLCKDNHIIFAYALNPALSMIYSREDEFQALLDKALQIQQLGVTNFSVFFDDIIPPQLGLEDRDIFDDPASAHIHVTNRLYEELKKRDPNVMVSFVPVPYWNWLPVLYNQRIVELLDPEIKIGWTGKSIVSNTVTLEDVQSFIDFFGQPPAFGDNWTRMTVHSRDAELYTKLDIFTNNPYGFGFKMRDGDRAKTQLQWFVNATMADYTWNPEQYDPETSLYHAARVIAGDEAAEWLKAAIEIVYNVDPDLGYEPGFHRRVQGLAALSGDALEQEKAAIRDYLISVRDSRHTALKDIADPRFRDHFGEIYDNLGPRIREALWLLKAGPDDPAELAQALGREVAR